MSTRWERDDSLLERSPELDGPFDSRPFIRGFLAAQPRWRDASWAGWLSDGTWARLAAVRRAGVVDAVRYGYGAVRSSRPLLPAELGDLLTEVRRAAGAHRLVLRVLGNPDAVPGAALRSLAPTSTVALVPEQEPEAGYSPSVRQALRKLDRAGAIVEPDLDGFGTIYGAAADRYQSRYPSPLLHSLARHGAARPFVVVLDGEPIAAALALVAGDHWMYWLAAQSDRGRAHEGGYLAVTSLIAAARDAGARRVNLGASWSGGRSLPGVAAFKAKFRPEECAMTELRTTSGPGVVLATGEAAARRVLAAPIRRARGVRRD